MPARPDLEHPSHIMFACRTPIFLVLINFIVESTKTERKKIGLELIVWFMYPCRVNE